MPFLTLHNLAHSCIFVWNPPPKDHPLIFSFDRQIGQKATSSHLLWIFAFPNAFRLTWRPSSLMPVMRPLPWWGTCCNGTPKKDPPLCRYPTESQDLGCRENFFYFFKNILITDLLLLFFSIAWCSTLGGAACVTEPDRLRVVRYNFLSHKTVKLPWGNNVAGVFSHRRLQYQLIE